MDNFLLHREASGYLRGNKILVRVAVLALECSHFKNTGNLSAVYQNTIDLVVSYSFWRRPSNWICFPLHFFVPESSIMVKSGKGVQSDPFGNTFTWRLNFPNVLLK